MSCCKNIEIKQGTTFKLAVEFSGGTDFSLDDVSKIEFVFKKQRSKDAEAIKVAEYPTNCLRVGETNVILVPFTEAETYDFPEGQAFYMDTKIYLTGSAQNPPTNIVEIMMSDTLFDGDIDPSIGTLEVNAKAAMTDGVGVAWTAAEQKAARQRIGEDQFELIETVIVEDEDVSIISRNKDTNGNNYNFKKLYAFVDFPRVTLSGKTMRFDERLYIGVDSNVTLNDQKYYIAVLGEVIGGRKFWDIRASIHEITNARRTELSLCSLGYDTGNINRIQFRMNDNTPLPVNTTMQIYGIWE